MAVSLELRNLTKRFPSEGDQPIVAVDNVSVNIEEGEMFSLLGESGCGKTTTLRILAGLETPTSGEIYFNGKNFTGVPVNKRGVGMVFQSYALYPHMTVFENVAYGLRIRKAPNKIVDQKVTESMEIVGLPVKTYGHRRPSELSGGQQQRVALARSLVYDPGVLLFDEPLSNLDAKLRVYMREELRKIQRAAKITAVYVTHDQEEALAISDRIAVMFDGRIEQLGKPADVYERPATVQVADFIGKANLLPGKIIERSGDSVIAEIQGTPGQISGRTPPEQDSKASSEGSEIKVMVRPEKMKIVTNGSNGDKEKTSETSVTKEGVNYLSATIEDYIYLGSRTRYELRTKGGHQVSVESVRLAENAGVGDSVVISFASSETLVLPPGGTK